MSTQRLHAPTALPTITDQPKAAFLAGWWGGITVGISIGAGIAICLLHGAR
jgi:hypothetical protein